MCEQAVFWTVKMYMLELQIYEQNQLDDVILIIPKALTIRAYLTTLFMPIYNALKIQAG